jgi:hypothetical protein
MSNKSIRWAIVSRSKIMIFNKCSVLIYVETFQTANASDCDVFNKKIHPWIFLHYSIK